jgi:3-oxoacyl-[acyl-carrier protein] reductase
MSSRGDSSSRRIAAIVGQLQPSQGALAHCAAAGSAPLPLKGKKALVTGGSRGVGESCCLQLAALGADVAVNYARTADRAAGVVEKCQAFGVKAVAIGADVSDDDECARLVADTVSALGGLDILVNNAGFTRYIPFADLEAVTRESWDSLMSANVYGQFNVGRAAYPHLKAAEGGGVIVNLGSQSGISNSASSIPYGVTKAACHGLTKMMSRAFAPHVRVNCIAPGFINTEWQRVSTAASTDLSALKFEQGSDAHEARLKEVAAGTLLDAACGPDDVADAVMSFVVYNKFVTGEILSVTGGAK